MGFCFLREDGLRMKIRDRFGRLILAFTGLVFAQQTNAPPPAFEPLWQFDTDG